MKISTQTRYAVRFLLELALHEKRQISVPNASHAGQHIRMTTQEIAKRQGISEKYLESIATKLKKGGFICSSKGVNGGFWMAVSPADITLGRVMRAMETTYFSVHCIDHADLFCKNYATCVVAKYWGKVESAISDVVDHVSIETIAAEMYDVALENLAPANAAQTSVPPTHVVPT